MPFEKTRNEYIRCPHDCDLVGETTLFLDTNTIISQCVVMGIHRSCEHENSIRTRITQQNQRAYERPLTGWDFYCFRNKRIEKEYAV